MSNPLNLSALTIEQLEAIASSNITDFVTLAGATTRLKPLTEIDPKKLVAIREISQSRGKTTIKLHDKIAALKLLNQYPKK
jgi:hypothetical protein